MLNPYLAILVLLAVGAFIGLANGLLIVKGRLNGFIVTLGMTIVLAGLQHGIVKGNTLFNLPAAFTYLGAADIRPGAGLADRHRGHLRRRPGCSCATTGPAGPSTRSAATARRPARRASRSTGSGSASTWPAACWPRSAG